MKKIREAWDRTEANMPQGVATWKRDIRSDFFKMNHGVNDGGSLNDSNDIW